MSSDTGIDHTDDPAPYMTDSGCELNELHDLPVCGTLCDTDSALQLIAAGEELDDLDHDLSVDDLSVDDLSVRLVKP
ncbi:MAG: hypothetical protein ABJQ14_09965 [Hyphomicrobiales bacterium]